MYLNMNPKMIKLGLAVMIVMCWLPQVVRAELLDQPPISLAPLERDNQKADAPGFKLSLEYGYYHVFGVVQAAENRGTDQLLGLSSELEMEHTMPGGGLLLSLALNRTHNQYLTLSHFQVTARGDGVAENDILFNGVTFSAGESIRTHFSFSDIKAYYTYLLRDQSKAAPRMTLALLTGIQIVYINTTIASRNTELHTKKFSTDEEFNTAGALVGANISLRLSSPLSLEWLIINSIPTGMQTDRGDTAEMDIKTRYALSRTFGLSLGYKSIFYHFHFRGDEGGGDFAENTADGSIRGFFFELTSCF